MLALGRALSSETHPFRRVDEIPTLLDRIPGRIPRVVLEGSSGVSGRLAWEAIRTGGEIRSDRGLLGADSIGGKNLEPSAPRGDDSRDFFPGYVSG